MLRDKHGITKKEKNHPQASDGSSRHDHQFSSVPTSTIVAQSFAVCKHDWSSRHLPDAKNFMEYLLVQGKLTNEEVVMLRHFFIDLGVNTCGCFFISTLLFFVD